MKIKQYIPALNWLPNYKKDWLSGDLAAGLTVGVMPSTARAMGR